jgi:hypothetical protein
MGQTPTGATIGSHTPNAAQLVNLALFAAARAAAEATHTTTLAALLVAQTNYRNAPSAATLAALGTAQSNLAASRATYRQAASDHSEYNSYIFLGFRRSNMLDSGGADGL